MIDDINLSEVEKGTKDFINKNSSKYIHLSLNIELFLRLINYLLPRIVNFIISLYLIYKKKETMKCTGVLLHRCIFSV